MSCAGEGVHLVDRLAVRSARQHRGRRLADAAAVAVEIGVANRAVVVDRQLDAHHVAAERILVLVGVRRAGQSPR